MCSILLWALPGFNHLSRGDVVSIQESDDFHWGDAVVGPNCTGQMRALVVPEVPAAAFEALLHGDVPPLGADGAPLTRPGEVLRVRKARLDLDALEAMEGRRVDHYEILVRSYADLMQHTVDHPVPVNPFEI